MTGTTHLTTVANIGDADDFYERLLRAHQGLDDHESQALNARLILILANHIGDTAVLAEAVDLALKASRTNDS